MKHTAMLYRGLGHSKVECFLCNHRCKIENKKFGLCKVRQNIDGELVACSYGNVIAQHIDPIEKKPLYHFLPGTYSYSIATSGCNFRCGFCQNWEISQPRQDHTSSLAIPEVAPEKIVREARNGNCKSIAYTYTEPTIFFEYAHDVARLAKREGLYNVFVTNGYMTKDALDKIRPYLDAANVDLKAFSDQTYRKICKARLQPVLDTIEYMRSIGMWIEITTLIVPGLNDSESELKSIAAFISAVGKDIPWHISRFHPDYQYTDSRPTPIPTMKKAFEIGKEAGLCYVYLGNVTEDTNTYCHVCGHCLIGRSYLYTIDLHVKGNRCPQCDTIMYGRLD